MRFFEAFSIAAAWLPTRKMSSAIKCLLQFLACPKGDSFLIERQLKNSRSELPKAPRSSNRRINFWLICFVAEALLFALAFVTVSLKDLPSNLPVSQFRSQQRSHATERHTAQKYTPPPLANRHSANDPHGVQRRNLLFQVAIIVRPHRAWLRLSGR